MREPFYTCWHLPLSKNWRADLSPATTVRPTPAQHSWIHLNLGHLLTSVRYFYGIPRSCPHGSVRFPGSLSVLSWSSCNNCVVFRWHWGTEFFFVAGVPLSWLVVHFSLQVLRLPGLCLSIGTRCPLWGPAALIVSPLPVSSVSLTRSNFPRLQGNLCS